MADRLGTPIKPTGLPLNTEGRCEIDLAREPGFGWRLSDEALREIKEMESANRRALAELLARGFLVGSRSTPVTHDEDGARK